MTNHPMCPALPTARDWFGQGERVPYDPRSQRVESAAILDSHPTLHVFRRKAGELDPRPSARWNTFLPGFPDGSFGWAKVDPFLVPLDGEPRLFVEYVGQGDSDKPAGYVHGTRERADLVEAHWRELGVQRTFVVTFDFSSLVLLELLRRQRERLDAGADPVTRIEQVLILNGGLFADAHSHPWLTTPLLKTPFGRMGTWIAQRSRLAFNGMVKVLWSKEYGVSREELAEYFDAITRRQGASFMSRAAGFVDEHRANARRWDLREVFLESRDTVDFHLAGSKGDPFEPNQLIRARERLGEYGIDIQVLPRGHLTTSEHPESLAELIVRTANKRIEVPSNGPRSRPA